MKKAKITLKKYTFIINISDELAYKNRIIDELAGMSLENNPLLNPRKELHDIPIIYWPKEDFSNKTHTDIEKILLEKEEEYQNLFQEEIVNQLGLQLKKKRWIYFGDEYKVSDKDDFVIDCEIRISKGNRHDYFQDKLDMLNSFL